MLNKLEATAVVDQRVAGYAGGVVVGLGETAVYDHHLAVRLYGMLTLARLHGNMTVYYVAVLTLHTEGVENGVAYLLLFAQPVIGSFLLVAYILVGEEVAFESSHLCLVEQR